MATDITQTNPDVLALERQKAMALALLKQGMEVPQGQMIGNRYVGAHPLQFLGGLAQQYVNSSSVGYYFLAATTANAAVTVTLAISSEL